MMTTKVTKMSSVEIAELTGKRHDNVMTDIRNMLNELGKAAPEFSGTAFYIANNAERTREIFNLDKEHTLILVSGYSIKMRAAIIRRWQQLEEAVSKLPDETKEAIGLRDDIMKSAYERERDLYIDRIEQEHKVSMQDIQQRIQAIEQREYVLVDGMKVKADMKASKASLPVVTITSIVKNEGIAPSEANKALFALGYLEVNPDKGDYFKVTKRGNYYGKNITSSKVCNTYYARWFEGTSQELLSEIKMQLL